MQRSPHNPILTRSDIPPVAPHVTDVTSVFNPGAIKVGERYILMLRVQTRGRETVLMLAESRDGEHFTVRPKLVEIAGLEAVREKIYHIYDPRLTQIGDTTYIVFAADVNGASRLGTAKTRDFERFELVSFGTTTDTRNGVLFPEKIDGRYARLERPNNVRLENGVMTGGAIILRQSDNLIDWHPVGPVLAGRWHYWDELIGSGPPPVKTRAGWLHVYHGIATHFAAANIYQAGVVLLDLQDPTRVLARTRNNILEPRELYELIGQVPNVVFPSGMIVEDYDADGFAQPSSLVRLYYGAADTVVGLFTATIDELLAACQAQTTAPMEPVTMRKFALVLNIALAAIAAAESKPVQLVVIVPDLEADQPKEIFISSSDDGWRELGRTLPRVAPGVYSRALNFAPGTAVTFKFTRAGTWATVEKTAGGQELPNRTLTADPAAREQLVVCRVERWTDREIPADRRVEFGSVLEKGAVSGPEPARPSTLTGDIHYHHAFRSPQLNNERTLIVYLPPDYDKNADERFPVLYMHDGQNIFDAKTSFAGEWGADETAERLIKAGQLPKLIIVGIYNNADRIAEYTPFRDEASGGGNGDAYLAFVVDTVKPFIDQTYRTQPQREHTAIAGSSLGGLISLYAAYKYPDVFGRAGVMSPSLVWGNGAVLKYVQEHKPAQPPRLWIDIGTEERGPNEKAEITAAMQACRTLLTVLDAAGMKSNTDYRYEEVRGGVHNESDWSHRFDQVLLFLFSDARPASK